MSPAAALEPTLDHEVVVIGAGFGGLYALHELREAGFSAHAFESGGGVGGTWYWNRYPGARCDVESVDYCYSFSRELNAEWAWSERFAGQPEILRYAEHVAERFDLLPMITFDTRITSARYDDGDHTWTVETDQGRRLRCRFLVAAVGALSATQVPEIPGHDRFTGPTHHTGRWPHEGVNLAGKRVGVIGTGSSGIQAIPEIAAEAAHLTVFQRTPNYSLPARNRPMSSREIWVAQRDYEGLLASGNATNAGVYNVGTGRPALADPPERRAEEYEHRWAVGGTDLMRTYGDTGRDVEANETLAEFVRGKIREIVADPATAASLVPTDHPIGSKRICLDSGYFATYNRDNVTLVDLRREPIVTITETGIDTDAASYDLDVLVFATGYDAMTGPLTRIDLRGADGDSLAQRWSGGPRSLLGIAVAGFPNLFTLTGPGSPSVLANVIRANEQHVDWVVACLTYLRERGLTRIEADAQAQDAWAAHVHEVATYTLYLHAKSWYLGANIDGKPRQFMPYIGGMVAYRKACDDCAAAGYPGFALAGAPRGSAAATPVTKPA
ncbi:cyclohexanone monooxygenase [Pseudofrankia sp. BMG5.36]|nr:cyclohexanone monooxygenase [Pseudofrankia sp. BMG5.36]